MYVSFDESNPSKEDIVVCDDDDDILKVPMEDITKNDKVDQTEHKEENTQQEQNQKDLPQEWITHCDHLIYKVIGDISK